MTPATASALKRNTDAMSEEEWRVRVDLAACYRLVAMFGWDDLIATHISARIPGRQNEFLINPFGMTFEEITASSLLKVNKDGDVISEGGYGMNAAGFTIHSAIHMVREDAHCIVHLHTIDGMAVSALEEGLLPLAQTSMLVASDVAFHEYEGIATDLAERERLQQDLGTHHVMILRNHGTLAVGDSVASAFMRIYHLERACSAQVRALSMGRALHHSTAAVVEKTAKSGRKSLGPYGGLAWPALLRRVDRLLPGYDA